MVFIGCAEVSVMQAHEIQIRVLYAHTDKAGVVYYANYLQFFEAGRTEYLRSLGKSCADFEKDGVILTVSEANCRYIKPAFYDDLLTVRTWVSRVRRTRVDFGYEVINPHGETVCEGSTVLACLDKVALRPRELPEEMKALLAGKD